MEKIYLLGDIHTANAFRLSGVEGFITDKSNLDANLDEILDKEDAAIIIITRALAENIPERISEVNLNLFLPVIIELPGIDDERGFGKSPAANFTEALGISI